MAGEEGERECICKVPGVRRSEGCIRQTCLIDRSILMWGRMIGDEVGESNRSSEVHDEGV